MIDKTFNDYRRELGTKLVGSVIRDTIDYLRPRKLFIRDQHGEWLPRRHAGYTLITPTFEDEAENIKAYVRLGDAQQHLFGKLKLSQCILAPLSAFHLTVARLVSGEEYEERIRERRDQLFIQTIANEFRRFPSYESIKMEIRGIAVLPGGFIAALLAAVNENEYRLLLSFRDQIYGSEVLKSFSVEPKRPFTGHVTLAYLQVPLTQEKRNKFIDTIQMVNQRYFSAPLPFEITRVELRKFDNYLKFDREPDWPVFRFIRKT